MFWTDIDHSFCESKILGLPEYINSITSLFISFFGIYGLCNKINDNFVDMLYSMLFIIGIGSFGYHYTGNIGWGLCDEIPMILLVFLNMIYVNNIYNELTLNNCNIIIYKIKLIIILFFMILFIICDTMSIFRLLFPIIFTLSSLYLCNDIYNIIILTKKDILYFFYNNMKIVILSGLIWIITELPCKYINYKILLLGHPLWHLFIGYGFYNILQIIYYVKLQILYKNRIKYNLQYNKFYLLNINYNIITFEENDKENI